MRIVIDAGHGGKDPGAVGNGLLEKVLTLAIALRIGQRLTYRGVDVTYTRDTDVFVELSDRAKIANQASANYFVSVHINATGTGTAVGFESYVYPGSAAGARDVLHDHIAALYLRAGFPDRGKQQANFAVLRETNMPAVLLEYGFIDNARDAAKLADPAWLDALADVTVEGLAAAFGLPDAPTLAETETTPQLPVGIANDIIDSYLSKSWFTFDAERKRAEDEGRTADAAAWLQLREWQHHLANELRKASRQKLG